MKKKDESITVKQKEFINNIMNSAKPPAPEFKGSTKKEASLYISKYVSRIRVNSWNSKPQL